ncbi:MAG: nucleotide sugar dehydrogenase, partial [Kangiellaceae bacterium]
KLYLQQKQTQRLLEFDEACTKKIVFDYILVADINLSSVFGLFADKIEDSIKNGCSIINLTPAEIGESEEIYLEYLESLKIEDANNEHFLPICCIPLLIREGRAIVDFSRPENIILGCDNDKQISGLRALFYPFNRAKDVVKVVSTRDAEFSSFAGNAMLATRLSFMNEMADLADRTGVDIEVVRECIGSDPRIGNDYLYPSCGFAGSALAGNLAKVAGALKTRTGDLGLLNVVAEINERQKDVLFRKIWKYFKTELSDKSIAIWGASFKPGSPSIASAPAVKLIESLIAQGANVKVYDPLANENIRSHFGKIDSVVLVDKRDEALNGCDALAICTEWKEFWSPDFDLIKSELNFPVIFDGRNLYQPNLLKTLGLKYFGIGRGERV